MPTNTDDSLGNDKWAVGPALVLLKIAKPWISGILAQHFWDFAGDSDAQSVNLSSLQYFVNYNFPNLGLPLARSTILSKNPFIIEQPIRYYTT